MHVNKRTRYDVGDCELGNTRYGSKANSGRARPGRASHRTPVGVSHVGSKFGSRLPVPTVSASRSRSSRQPYWGNLATALLALQSQKCLTPSNLASPNLEYAHNETNLRLRHPTDQCKPEPISGTVALINGRQPPTIHTSHTDPSWKEREKMGLPCYKLIPSGTPSALPTPEYTLTIRRNSIQDALRAFLLPIKNDDTRLDFYTVYKKEATEYDVDYIKKYDEDLNTTLIFVRHPPLALTA